MNQNNILLESGTNELEIVEFSVGNSQFGINVIKVREIIVSQPVYTIPHSHPYLEGVTQLRGEVLPVIDLAAALNLQRTNNADNDKFIVTEFNKMKVIFHVHDVSLIRRISWGDIEKPTTLHNSEEYSVTGVIKLESHMILLLDFEKIIVDISPKSGLYESKMDFKKREESNKKIVIAEDSLLIQKLLKDTLVQAGYTNVTFFSNGKEALDFFEEKENIEVDLVITDIEMPQMDGHHFTKRLKESDRFKDIPVVIFSSLITDDLRYKGEMVGADAQVSKPELSELVEIIDRLA
ncbi:chemotaxis protein CheV [Fredinandcohnia quinoae]|uniref:Chemotaxis protein n=1 Tax=Fredinandcohnia quinoae TaxID=2918902 RepID=A0AAW5E956_9BACI|nr:chemotaxis protein [Fredinandcohnia sp. SECRCQ15]MCH1627770.1 chemotaxis protein [Fredinandcohnia sp. SECRCQ15]